MGFLFILMLVLGVVLGVVWYKKVDKPREKFVKTGADDNVIIDGRYGMMHHIQNPTDVSDGGFDGGFDG